MNSPDYHDYVIKDGKFIGEFEQMYQRVADPWHCVGQVGSFKNSLLLGAVHHVGGATRIKRALDVGCGLGVLTERLRQTLPSAEWHACDVSATAVERATQEYPGVHFFVQDLSRIETLPFEPSSLDLITMSEVMWYVLPHLSAIFAEFYRLLRSGGHVLLLQYFLSPEEQSYGKEIVAGPNDLLRFVSASGFEIRQEIYVGACAPQDLLLLAMKRSL